MRLLLVIGALIAALLTWLVFKSYTWPILTENGIAELEAIEVNGDRQWVLIRGEDRHAPILFFLHGGPGMAAMYLGHAFQRPLEKDLVVVHWDQRGAGKSFHSDIDPRTLSTSQLIRDAERVIEHVQEKLGKKKVFLVGHSHGSFLGVILASRRPDLVTAYVGVGQMAGDATPVQDEFLRSKLGELSLPTDAKIDGRNREDLLFATHSELFDATSPLPLILTGMMATEYSLFDALNVPKGPQLYAKHMKYDVVAGSYIPSLNAFEMPVYFVMGVKDMVTPVSQARAYFDKLSAPRKRWYEFERSAHFPFYEEPARFAEVMREIKAETAVAPVDKVRIRTEVSLTDGRFSGFLTFGCGDSYIKIPTVSETWFVDLPPRRQQQIFGLSKVDRDKYTTWWTFHVEIEGRVQSKPRRGYFFDHPKELIVERFVAARYPDNGETIRAATESASAHRGYLVLGPEGIGFIDELRKDESWWVIPGADAGKKIAKYYSGKNSIIDHPRPETLFIEFVGAVGPPGGYGHENGYNREVAINDYTFVRNVAPDELVGTAGVVDVDVPGSGVADINKCKPQRR